MKVIVSCSRKFHAFALVEQLQKRGIEVLFFTSYTSINSHIFKYFVRREDREEICPKCFRTNLIIAFGLKIFSKNPQLINNYFDRWVSKSIRYVKADIFIGWSGMSLESIKVAKSLGLRTILERGSTHICFQNRILRAEYQLRKIEFAINPYTIEKEKMEYELVDHIVIPSHFVERTFLDEGIERERIFVNPFGVSGFFPKREFAQTSTFRVLYLGKISIRKGAFYFLEAFDKLSQQGIEFWIIGEVEKELKAICDRLGNKSCFHFFGHIKHYELAKYIAQCSVAIQPSLEEGQSMVLNQILSVGVPIIATPNSGAEELVIDGYNGFIIEASSVLSIEKSILSLYLDSSRLKELTTNTESFSDESHSWAAYGSRYIKFLCQ